MASDDHLQAAILSAQLELDFERAKQQAERIYEDERARILRVNLLLQEDINDELQEQLEHIQDVDLKQSEDHVEDLSARLADLEEQYQQTQTDLKTCLRDIDAYQAEINALNAASTGSTKLLTEKLALSRELSALKPELEHLRSQATSQQNALADKLSLQRELSTVQVELEQEKRTTQRLKQKPQTHDDTMLNEEIEELKEQLGKEKKLVQKLERQTAKQASQKSAADAALVDELESVKQELGEAKKRAQQVEKRLEEATRNHSVAEQDSAQLDQLKADLAKEKKALAKAEREALKGASEWDVQKETLETKLDAFRNKLRSTKEQLKEAQDELERREQAKFAESAAATKARIAGRAASVEPTQNPKKRNVARFDPDMTIGTPGNGGPAAKNPRTTLSTVGDKSTFSITPFLNRTMSILPESPNAVMNTTINELAEEAEKEKEPGNDREKAKKPAAAATKKKADVKEAPSKKAADKPKAAKPLKEAANARLNAVVKAPTLDKVIEEDDAEAESGGQENLASSKAVIVEVSETTTLEPKKKKLLGARKNIFDDEEPDGIKKAGGLGKVKLGLGKNKPRMLAEFSPLKKDRRMTSFVGA
ncbi:hypothetical protein PMZ80_000693 [Knufia obscura]|uniref:Uncharacterized protein n=1 Tax=Knufia obscura TaxID=1635080 RepID=A0ABR0S1Z4_9EURO|nr:hypothetical protein PMZ80_000693 [Knufia obscura]